MPPELIAAVLGPVVGAVFGIVGFSSKRNLATTDSQLDSIAENVEVISHQVTNLQIQLPTKYVTKEELLQHIKGEDRWQQELMREIREIREEVIVLRVNNHH